jgi:hypothetical protein
VGNKLYAALRVAAAWDAKAIILTVYRLGRFPG